MKEKQIPIWICKFLILISFSATMEIWNTYNKVLINFGKQNHFNTTEEKKDIRRSFVDQNQITD